MTSYPEPCVGALIVKEDGKIFLMKSPKWFDRYVVPGGHVDMGETREDALIREVKEEVGLDIEVKDLLCTFDAVYLKEFYKRKHFIFFDYEAHAKTTDVKLDGVEATDFVWVTPEEGLKLNNLESTTKQIIEEYLRRKKR